jgi:Trk K+ transport system NAD-binding subunit
MFVVRPINTAVCVAGSGLTRQERLFIGWLSPRGIVAAAVASLFAQRLNEAGIAGGGDLRAMVFLVIAVTVVIQGSTGGWVASFLGVRRPVNNGFAIVGANAVGRALASALRGLGEDVVLIDSNARETREAEEAGLSVIYGNANDERTLTRADIDGRRGIAAVTPNPDANLLIANQVSELTRNPRTFVTLARGRAGARARRVHREGHAVTFGRPIDVNQWNHTIEHGQASPERWRYGGTGKADEERGSVILQRGSAPHLVPLVLRRGGKVELVDEDTQVREGDEMTFLVDRGEGAEVVDLLRVAGWRPVETVAETPTESGAGRV